MTDADKLALLWDERLITGVMLRFGRSLDLGDWRACRACFGDVVDVNFERLTGFAEIRADPDDLVAFGDAILSPTRRHHVYSNFHITINGDRASAIVYLTARHWKATDLGASDYNQYGWYEVSFARHETDWRLTRIKHDFQWVDGNNALFDMRDPVLIAALHRLFVESEALPEPA